MSPASSNYSPRSKRLSLQLRTSLILRRIITRRNARLIDGTNSKQSKARNELMAAMVESQTAGLTAINSKIASLTVGPTVAPPGQVSVTITSNPHVMTESHEVLAEQTQVALVRLQSILNPPSKKYRKKNS